jgi:hypothetical protein
MLGPATAYSSSGENHSIHQTGGRFTRDQFRYEPAENAYYCPEGKPLRCYSQRREAQGYAYRSTAAQCRGCPQKKRCTSAAYRKLFVHGQESARRRRAQRACERAISVPAPGVKSPPARLAVTVAAVATSLLLYEMLSMPSDSSVRTGLLVVRVFPNSNLRILDKLFPIERTHDPRTRKKENGRASYGSPVW